MTVLDVKDGGTGITPVNGYVLVSASNCAPINDSFGLTVFEGFIGVMCIVAFFGLLALRDI